MSVTPVQEWWSAAEIAEARLPDMPTTKRRINDMAARLRWGEDLHRARRRAGRGGGWEYHWTLLPSRAQGLLLAQLKNKPKSAATRPERDEAWTWYDQLPNKPKAEAARRLAILQKVDAFEAGGSTRRLAVVDVAQISGVAPRTIWNWLDLVSGVRADDRLPYLAPRHRTGKSSKRATAIDPRFGDLLKADFLRPEQPSFKSVYDRCVRIAAKEGLDVVPVHTAQRWIKRAVSPTALVYARKGYEALKRMRPAQSRDKTAMHALEGVNGDFHRFDVFVRFPASSDGQPEEVIRPQMCAFQDIHSGMILSYRIDRTPNSHCVQLTIGDLIEKWGIPEHVLLDNGREFAAKLITGGSKTRYRFKVKEDDPSGLLTSLGCEIHWALPYSGQSKPIERAFRDMCDRIAKHPAFAGAYTGNRPDAQPENYGEKAIPLDLFKTILDEEIAAHNARPDRRSEVAYGRSFQSVFEESYAQAPIRKATAEQRRLWLMGAEGIRTNSTTGQINFMGNRYWADWMSEITGQKVVVRFDRQALWEGVHVYSTADAYLGFAPCMIKAGFFDMDDARATAKAKKAWAKARKAELDAYRRLTASDVAAALEDTAPQPVDVPIEAKVVRPLFDAPKTPAPAPASDEVAAVQSALVADLDTARFTKRSEQEEEDSRDTFIRARDLEQRQASGAPLTKQQQVWLAGYQTTAEYRTWSGMVEDFGEDVLSK
ncbi:transposase domain-containing protein [Cognatiyoonia sp. IB215182]|uniref:transposase domain-containing protein n=1 Tax=Cognatiyoonia sp. IB215182 TaxID=3097353 RepID=UPI002A0C4014|nr:transposase domain-containing protein [Cognatiyoonia sp. IB215182]MDX8354326.1 transposase domain-containing protein [Cognatiyoonia sp. IB215182]